MSISQALLLGIVQGLTEFLPVSSSGHLVIVEYLMNISFSTDSMMGFDIILHAGTLVGLLFIYWRTWVRLIKSIFISDHKYCVFMMAIIIATIPAVIVGLFLQDFITASFRNIASVGLSMIITGIILLLSETFSQKQKAYDLSYRKALWIGFAQVFALIPGLSRSGFTISAGRAVGLSRKDALDFSFLMATPVIGGALILTLKDFVLEEIILPQITLLIVGFITSLIVSIVAIMFLRNWVVEHSLGWFAVYLIPVGMMLIFV